MTELGDYNQCLLSDAYKVINLTYKFFGDNMIKLC